MSDKILVNLTVNGQAHTVAVDPLTPLKQVIRHDLGLTGTKSGCEVGDCGACTVLLDGFPVRSCLIFAIQAADQELTTIEGLAPSKTDGTEGLHPIQEAFWDAHGLQCGFCTPGILMTLVPYIEENSEPTEAEIRDVLSGNLCRCTGYQHIVDATLLAAERMRNGEG